MTPQQKRKVLSSLAYDKINHHQKRIFCELNELGKSETRAKKRAKFFKLRLKILSAGGSTKMRSFQCVCLS